MSKGTEWENPRKKLQEIQVETDWEDGAILLPGPPSRKVLPLKDTLPESYSIIDRVNLLLQRISELESRVMRLEAQLSKRKEK